MTGKIEELQFMNKIISTPHITISIASHGHADDISNLLSDLDNYCDDNISVIITLNIPEAIPEYWLNKSFPVHIVHNKQPYGFSKNHNTAFKLATGAYFCVINPDVRLIANPFPTLLENFSESGSGSTLGVVAPAAIDESGALQDNARHFPTITCLLRRNLLQMRNLEYSMLERHTYPDWVGGMFMLFNSDIYRAIGGFDEKYFLYCEDVDLCARLHHAKYAILLDNAVKIIHPGRRDSHRSWRHFYWHLSSMGRLFRRHYLTYNLVQS